MGAYAMENVDVDLKTISRENCLHIPVIGVLLSPTAITLRSGKYSAVGLPLTSMPLYTASFEPSPYRNTRLSVVPLYCSANRIAVIFARSLAEPVHQICTLLMPVAGAAVNVTLPALRTPV